MQMSRCKERACVKNERPHIHIYIQNEDLLMSYILEISPYIKAKCDNTPNLYDQKMLRFSNKEHINTSNNLTISKT
jgi:hypothetical protein